MAKRSVLPVVSAAVTPSIMEEIDRLAASTNRSRSEVVRTLLEERLTQRANERMEGAFGKVEARLTAIDNRFSGMLVKAIRLIAEDYYLHRYYYWNYTDQDDKKYQQMLEKARAFAGDQLKQSAPQPKTKSES